MATRLLGRKQQLVGKFSNGLRADQNTGGAHLQSPMRTAMHGKSMGGGGTPILGHIRDVRPDWVSFPGQKPADGCKFLTKNLRMGHNFDIILPGNG